MHTNTLTRVHSHPTDTQGMGREWHRRQVDQSSEVTHAQGCTRFEPKRKPIRGEARACQGVLVSGDELKRRSGGQSQGYTP